MAFTGHNHLIPIPFPVEQGEPLERVRHYNESTVWPSTYLFSQATVEDELRLVVTHMKEDAREAADTQASLRKVLQDQEETGRQATAKVQFFFAVKLLKYHWARVIIIELFLRVEHSTIYLKCYWSRPL